MNTPWGMASVIASFTAVQAAYEPKITPPSLLNTFTAVQAAYEFGGTLAAHVPNFTAVQAAYENRQVPGV